ncbi:hypothetical protein [Prevotella sp. kh1p2]|uniref:hypothetical protein n=1 Tax=Prevotella sp. kh1p2 TaxID=1761883 RepID=UPI0008BF607D|nr:hypothetical protein [Prevotella sp. kh1p2]SES88738.1 hypothetical protein SAMN04487825_10731 [Prevotella sp. kh1p2]SNU11666.1 hypothetical protein SAMN06298210_11287 [Prevotellaceae bacterium KH2P17]
MKKEVTKSPKVALCRECHGTGLMRNVYGATVIPCPQCEGSGRVMVSCTMTLDIRPYKEKR